jgi:tetratricopeptide (TPR) repeat protein
MFRVGILRMPPCILLIAVLLGGCGTLPAEVAVSEPDETWLLRGEGVPGIEPGGPALPEDRVLELSEPMKRFAEAAVALHYSPEGKLRALLNALVTPDGLGLRYDDNATFSAEETFRRARANCLSFTALIVPMLRHVGVQAYFNEVDVPPVWGIQDTETLVLYRHINAKLGPRSKPRQVVDINLDEYDVSFRQRIIPDRLAEAQYYNNRAMELLFEDRLGESYRYLVKALTLDDEVSYFWSNLGALYRRLGRLDAAEAAYGRAMRSDPSDLVAVSNAARLYAELGQTERAAELERKAQYFRERNPYYHYQQALHAFVESDYALARQHVSAALRDHEQEHRFHFLMGAIQRQLGDRRGAAASFSRAVELAADPDQAERYRRKIELLSAVRQPPVAMVR